MRLNNIRNQLSWLIFLPVLITGNVFYEERLTIGSLSLNTLLFLLAFLLMLTNRTSIINAKHILIFTLPAFLFLFTFILLDNVQVTGVYKYLNALLIGGVGSCIMLNAKNDEQVNNLLKLLVWFFFALFVLALIWKIKYGFWRRDISYFMNGPIVFGRHMAIGLLALALVEIKKSYKTLLLLSFAFGLLWSMSKGPILAFFVSYIFIYFKKSRLRFLGIFVIAVALFYTLITGHIDLTDTELRRVQLGLQAVFGIGEEAGSVGARSEMYHITFGLIQNEPITGVGPGNWGEAVNSIFTYPHNFFLEVISELGVIAGAFLLIPFLAFVLKLRSPYATLPLFVLVSQQVSGDVSDARWLLMFSLFVFLFKNRVSWINEKF